MRPILTLLIACLLTACAAPQYTVDDGRLIDAALLERMRAYGQGEQAIRPAIVRSAKLQDADCEKQWELPFSVATSFGASVDQRMAWVRALNVDERLTVIAASKASPLQPGDKIVKVGAFDIAATDKLLQLLEKLRDDGFPFDVQLSNRKTLRVVPFRVCRGYARFAPPGNPNLQSFHWQMIVFPLEVARAGLSPDQALWMVLWAQGVSEEGGARMKAYHYGTGMLGTLFTLASGIQSASVASNVGLSVAKSAASSVATGMLKNQLADQAASSAQKRQRIKDAMQRAAANRSSLTGIDWAASTVFEEADEWAYLRLDRLNANPLAGFSLHQKLIEQDATSNFLVFDPKRLKALGKIADEEGYGDEVQALLQGIEPDEL